MSIENPNFDMKHKQKKTNLSDRNNSIRNTPKPKYITHSIVFQFIEDHVSDEVIKEKLFIKLKKCPDGALQNFVDTIEKKIEIILQEMSHKNDKKNLQRNPQEITIEDMISIRNKLSQESVKEFENEQSQG